jgi:signal transduction histidine kinase
LLAALVVAGAGVAVGLFTLRIVAREPALSFAGSSAAGRLALVGAGWALIACGLSFWLRRSSSHFGPLLAAAGFAWFLLEWNTPTTDSALAFTVGLVLFASCPPLAGHAFLTFGAGRLSGWAQHTAVASLYAGSIVFLGALPTLVADPARGSCGDACPANLLVVTYRPALAGHLERVGLWVSVVAACAVAAAIAVALLRASRAARGVLWPVLVPGVAYLALVAALDAAWLDEGLLWSGPTERRLWSAQAVTLIGVVAGVVWNGLRARRRRTAVARLVVRLAQSPPPGGLRSALAEIVGDPGLELGYPLDGSDRLVDADGRIVRLSPTSQQTSLVAGRRRLAVLAHRPGLLDDEGLVRAVTDAARLVLENERLQAEARARLDELRSSRARIVEAGDAERRRLERDLHDGAQQRLAGLALSLRLLRSRLPGDVDRRTALELTAAETDVQKAIESLRALAHGIFPAVLADGGLAAAVIALAEESSIPIRVEAMSGDRFPPGLEAAAYRVVAETVGAAEGSVSLRASHADDSLVVDVVAHGLGARFDRTELEDRVGAESGRLAVTEQNGDVSVHAEFPCAS